MLLFPWGGVGGFGFVVGFGPQKKKTAGEGVGDLPRGPPGAEKPERNPGGRKASGPKPCHGEGSTAGQTPGAVRSWGTWRQKFIKPRHPPGGFRLQKKTAQPLETGIFGCEGVWFRNRDKNNAGAGPWESAGNQPWVIVPGRRQKRTTVFLGFSVRRDPGKKTEVVPRGIPPGGPLGRVPLGKGQRK